MKKLPSDAPDSSAARKPNGAIRTKCRSPARPVECRAGAIRRIVVDCNVNGLGDDLDISLGLSADRNANGIPDECESCPADFNSDGRTDVLDFVAFQVAWTAQDPAADCDLNAAFNVLDFVCFQQVFVKGCK